MAMGIVSDKDFEQEKSKLQREESLPVTIPNARVEIIEKGRGTGNLAVPDSLRKVIGETSEIEGRAAGVELARQFGISPSSVSAYANGAHSTATYETKTDVAVHVSSAKERVQKRARNRLMAALSQLTPEKISEAKAVEISAIAKNMSSIVKDMEPDTPESGNSKQNGPTIVIYSPQIRNEQAYDVMYAKE